MRNPLVPLSFGLLLVFGAMLVAYFIWSSEASRSVLQATPGIVSDEYRCGQTYLGNELAAVEPNARGSLQNKEGSTPPSTPPSAEPNPHAAYYRTETTEAKLAYLDRLVTADVASSSKFLWDMILHRQSSSVSIRALEVALKIAANREKSEDLAAVFSRAFEAPASEIRRRALALVETYPEPLIVPYLGEIIDLPREEAPLALIALARIGNYQARDKLLEVAKNAKAAKDLRIRAIILVGASKDKFARSTLEDIAREEDEELRKAAEQALRELSK